MSLSRDRRVALDQQLAGFFNDSALRLEVHRFEPELAEALAAATVPAEYRHQLIEALDRRGLLADFRDAVLRPRMTLQADALRRAVERGDAPRSPAAVPIRRDDCPYPGMQAFSSEESELFFGRNHDVDALHELVTASTYRWLRVEGPSGVGKSSLVHAGLLPRLRPRAAVAGPGEWVVVSVLPGPAPMDNLASAIARTVRGGGEHWGEIRARLAAEHDGLCGLIRGYTLDGQRLLLVVDQLEELWTVADPGQSRAFEAAVVQALNDRELRFSLLTTIRTDQSERMPKMARRLGAELNSAVTRPYTVLPLTRSALYAVILGPAGRRGVEVQSGLAGRICDQVEQDGSLEGSLPLVAHALRELWHRCAGNYTLEYDETFEIREMLALSADRALATFGGPDAPAHARVRQLFLALANPDPEVPLARATARPLPRRTAIELLGAQQGEEILARLTGRRTEHGQVLALLRTTGEGKDARVDLIHEALLRHWQTYRRWLEDAAEDRRLANELSTAAARWEALGRPGDGLPRGSMLAALLAVQPAGTSREVDRAYQEALRHHDGLQTAQEARRTAQEARRRRRTVVVYAALLGLVTVLAVIVSLWAYSESYARRRLERANMRSKSHARATRDTLRVATASDALGRGDVALALGVLREVETKGANRWVPHWTLHAARALAAPWRERTRLLGHTDDVLAAAFNPGGDRVVTASRDGTARVWDVAAGSSRELRGHTAEVSFAAYGPTGEYLVTASADETARVWDPDGGTERFVLPLGGPIATVAFSRPETFDDRILTATKDGTVRVWDVRSGALVRELLGPGYGVDLSRDGTQVAILSGDQLLVWSVETGELLARLANRMFTALAFDSHTDRMVTGSIDGTAQVWSTRTWEALDAPLVHDDTVMSVGWFGASSVVVGVTGGSARSWRTGPDPRIEWTLPGQRGPLRSIAWGPGREEAVTLSDTGTARVWNLATASTTAVLGNDLNMVHYSVSSRNSDIVTASPDHTARIWERARGPTVETFRGGDGLFGVEFSADDTKLLALSARGVVSWRLDSGAIVEELCKFEERATTVFCKDRPLVVTSSPDRRLRLWDAHTGAELLELAHEPRARRARKTGARGVESSRCAQSPAFGTMSAACSPDGAQLLVFGPHGPRGSWSTRTGAVVPWSARSRSSMIARYSRDGAHILAGTRDAAYIFAASSGKLVTTFNLSLGEGAATEADAGRLVSVAFTDRGARVVEELADGTLQLWDPVVPARIATLEETRNAASLAPKRPGLRRAPDLRWAASERLAFSPDGARFAAVLPDRMVRVWNADTGKIALTPGSEELYDSVQYSPDGAHIIAVSDTGDAVLWDAATGVNARPPLYMGFQRAGMAPSADGERLVTVGQQGASLWNTDTGEEISVAPLARGEIVHAATRGAEIRAVTGSASGVVRLVDVRTGRRIAALDGHLGTPRAAIFSPAGKGVATISREGVAQLWNAVTGAEIRRLEGHDGAITGLAYDRASTRIVTVSDDGTARLWDAGGNAIGRVYRGAGPLRSVVHAPYGARVVLVSLAGKATLWDTNTGLELPLEYPADARSVAFSHAGTHVAIGFQDGKARVWDVSDGAPRTLLAGHTAAVDAVAFSQDGAYVATGSDDGKAMVWERSDGTAVAVLAGHRQGIASLAFSRDGSRVAAGSREGNVLVWSDWKDESSLLRRLWSATSVCPSLDDRRTFLGEPSDVAALATDQCERMIDCLRAASNDEEGFKACLVTFRSATQSRFAFAGL